MRRRTCSAFELDTLDGKCACMHFLLPKTLLESLAVLRPPLAIEDVGDDFDHDHLIAFDIRVGPLPQSRRRTARIGRHAAKALGQLGPHLGEHLGGYVRSIAKM